MLNDKDRDKICLLAKKLNGGEALNGDDIELIAEALKEFNGDD